MNPNQTPLIKWFINIGFSFDDFGFHYAANNLSVQSIQSISSVCVINQHNILYKEFTRKLTTFTAGL